VNGKRYIGSAVSLPRRRRQHLTALNAGKHVNRVLMAAWRKYGPESFLFSALVVCEKTELIAYEQRCFDVMAPAYNLAPRAGSQLGFRHSAATIAVFAQRVPRVWTDEQRRAAALQSTGRKRSKESIAKVVAAITGRKLSDAHRSKISAFHKGRPSPLRGRRRTPAAIAASSAALRGRKLSESHKAKLRAKWRDTPIACAGCDITFYRHVKKQSFCSLSCFATSPQTRRRISEAMKGRVVSIETRAKIGAKHKGKVISADVRAKMAAAKVGVRASAETKAKISAAVRARGPEYHAKLSASKIGNKNSLGRRHPPEVLAKIAAASRAMWAKRRSP
jgi:group I intron endonuclease